MSIQFRRYAGQEDYGRISRFLIQHHQPGNRDGNWLEPVWEYMHSHPMLDPSTLDRSGIWEENGEIVAVAHSEWGPGEAFFQFHPAYTHLRETLLDYAEQALVGRREEDDRPYLHAFVNNVDAPFRALVEARGYVRRSEGDRPMAQFAIPDPFPEITLPAGFRLKSLADEPDWAKVHRVMWRGFDHSGEPPGGEEELEDRRKMFDTPTARRDLKIVVEAPNGDFVALCGMFYEPNGRFAYVEPVATDPDYRRLGLGKAAVLEGIRRCGVLGATTAYVGSDQPFYLALGFEVSYVSECWEKLF